MSAKIFNDTGSMIALLCFTVAIISIIYISARELDRIFSGSEFQRRNEKTFDE